MDMPIEFPFSIAAFCAALAVVFVAYVVYGVSGFGSTMIAVPLLAHLFPLKFTVPLVVMLDCVAAVSIGLRFRDDISKPDAAWVVPGMLAGVAAGTSLLLLLPASHLLTALGTFLLLYGARNAAGPHGAGAPRPIPRWLGLPAGLAAGTMSSAVGAGGPIYMLYFSRRLTDKGQLRSTISAVFALSTIVRIAVFIGAGLMLQPGLLLLGAALAPMLYLGLFVGHRLHVGISREQMMRGIGLLLACAGASLLWRAWGAA